MFEHLVPSIGQEGSSRKTSLTFYIIALFLAFIIFISSLGIDKGSSTSAYGYTFEKVDIQVDNQDYSLVSNIGDLSVFKFNIIAKDSDTFLNKLKVYVQGLYNPLIFKDLRIYHNGVQLGYETIIDEYGYLSFDLENYPLSYGNNNFSFVIESSNINIGDIIQFSFENPFSIILSHGKNKLLFTPSVSYPLNSGLISFVEQGGIYTYLDNTYPFFLSSDTSTKLTSFSISNLNEIVDIHKLIINCKTEESLDNSLFVLLNNGSAVSQGVYNKETEVIDFNLFNPLVLSNKEDLSLQLHVSKLLEGKYSFTLENIEGIGFSSGLDINLDNKLFLGDIYVKDNFLVIKDKYNNNQLSEGWNTLQEISIRSTNNDISLHKLDWSIESIASNIDDIEVYINNTKIDNFIFDNNILNIIFDYPLNIDTQGLDIKILVNVSDIKNGSIIKSRLLSNNIIWFFDGDEYNGDMLPYLPLDPIILSY